MCLCVCVCATFAFLTTARQGPQYTEQNILIIIYYYNVRVLKKSCFFKLMSKPTNPTAIDETLSKLHHQGCRIESAIRLTLSNQNQIADLLVHQHQEYMAQFRHTQESLIALREKDNTGSPLLLHPSLHPHPAIIASGPCSGSKRARSESPNTDNNNKPNVDEPEPHYAALFLAIEPAIACEVNIPGQGTQTGSLIGRKGPWVWVKTDKQNNPCACRKTWIVKPSAAEIDVAIRAAAGGSRKRLPKMVTAQCDKRPQPDHRHMIQSKLTFTPVANDAEALDDEVTTGDEVETEEH